MEALDRTIQINGLKLHYLEWCTVSAPTILLLHGFMGHAYIWDDLAMRLSTRYRVLALDQRGHGNSGWAEGMCYGLDHHFTDLSLFIDALQIESLTLLGHSMGGRNALFYTACRPEMVERLVLVDARIGSSRESDAALRQQMKSLPVRAKSIREVADSLHALNPYLPEETRIRMAVHGYRKGRDGWLVPKFDMQMCRQIAGECEAITDLLQMMENVACPILLIRGRESPFVSGIEFERLRDHYPEAVLREVSASSHMPAQENPEEFQQVLLAFLAGHKVATDP